MEGARDRSQRKARTFAELRGVTTGCRISPNRAAENRNGRFPQERSDMTLTLSPVQPSLTTVEQLVRHGDIVAYIAVRRGLIWFVAGHRPSVESQATIEIKLPPHITITTREFPTSGELAAEVADLLPEEGDTRTFKHAECQKSEPYKCQSCKTYDQPYKDNQGREYLSEEEVPRRTPRIFDGAFEFIEKKESAPKSTS